MTTFIKADFLAGLVHSGMCCECNARFSPGVDILESLPQVQIKQCLEKIHKKEGGAAKSQTLRVLVTMINVQSYDSAIRKTLNKYGLLGSVVRRKPHLLKKNMTAQLTFL